LVCCDKKPHKFRGSKFAVSPDPCNLRPYNSNLFWTALSPTGVCPRNISAAEHLAAII
jgi:hypothetical protein